MGRIYVEDTKITITEKATSEGAQYVIQDDRYILNSTEVRNFQSSIYTYSTGEKVLISKVILFSKDHYKIVLYDETQQIAWNLIDLPTEHDVRVKRLTGDMFFIWTKNQFSFCRTKPSAVVEEFTTNFTKLKDVRFGRDFVLACFKDEDLENPGKYKKTVIAFGYDGKRIKTHHED